MEFITLISIPIIIVLLIALSWLWPPDSPWAPWWRTKSKTARRAFKLVKLSEKDVVYELGSGEATALIVAAKEFDAKCVGIEIEPFRFYLSKFTILRKGLSSKIEIRRGDIFNEKLSDATIVYVYLVPKALDKLIPKFKKELKKGTLIVSYKYEMKLTLVKEDKKNNLRIYKI